MFNFTVLSSEAFELRIEFGHRVTFTARARDIGSGCFHLVTEFTFKLSSFLGQRLIWRIAFMRSICSLDERENRDVPLTAICVST